MVSLRIEIIENGNKVDKTVNIPQGWNEVSAELFPYLATMWLKGELEMPMYDKQVRVLTLLAEKAWPALELLEDNELYDLLNLVNWVFEGLDLSKNHLPVIEIDNTTFYGPEDELSNLRWAEWVYADSNFVYYQQTDNVKYLDKFLAAIYRPAGIGKQYVPGDPTYRADKREKFNGNNVDSRAELFAKLPLVQKQGIYLFFLSCRWNMRQYYPHVFPDPEKNKSKKPNKDEPDFGWIGVHDDLSGEKGRSPEQLEDEFLSTILLSMERSLIKWEKYKTEK